MQTRATRVGAAVPHSVSGVVRAAFRRSCVVALEAASPLVRLIVLQDAALPMTPVSVAIAGFRGCAEGERVRVGRRGALLVGAWEVSLEGAERFEGLAGAVEGPFTSPRQDGSDRSHLADAVGRLGRTGRTGSSRFPSDDPFRGAVVARVEALAAAVRRRDHVAAEAAALALVGLGPGLTPSGDDALCGFLLGRGLAGARSRTDAAVARVAESAWERTSDVSAQFLSLAARGRHGEALLGVAEALRSGVDGRVLAAVDRCHAQGATSGADALLGLCAALETDGTHRAAHAAFVRGAFA